MQLLVYQALLWLPVAMQLMVQLGMLFSLLVSVVVRLVAPSWCQLATLHPLQVVLVVLCLCLVVQAAREAAAMCRCRVVLVVLTAQVGVCVCHLEMVVVLALEMWH
jgi:hypothetical protein